jgi:hypothetical protein
MLTPRLIALPLLLAALLVPAGADAKYHRPQIGHTSQGGVAFRIHVKGEKVWTTDFHFVTRCGTVRIPGRLYWGTSHPDFGYRSKDGRVRMYTLVGVGPHGGGSGWVSDRRANGCRSGKLTFQIETV